MFKCSNVQSTVQGTKILQFTEIKILQQIVQCRKKLDLVHGPHLLSNVFDHITGIQWYVCLMKRYHSTKRSTCDTSD